MTAGAIALIVLALFVLITAMAGVRIDGVVWTARSFMDDETFEAGTRVQVVEIRGATALVTD